MTAKDSARESTGGNVPEQPSPATEAGAFSVRLKQALLDAGYDDLRPTVVQRLFNKQFSGYPVSVPAVRKWMLGASIPTHEKIRALGEWLAVSPTWLRFGEDSGESGGPSHAERRNLFGDELLRDLQYLPPEQRELVRALVELFKNRDKT